MLTMEYIKEDIFSLKKFIEVELIYCAFGVQQSDSVIIFFFQNFSIIG